MKKLVPGCLWASEKLLVGLRARKTPGLPSTLVADLSAAGVDCVFNLLSKVQFREAGADALFGPMDTISREAKTRGSKIVMGYAFWPDGDEMPSARQMRLALDDLDGFASFGLTVFVNGADNPVRAVMAAGCWLARHESEATVGDTDPEATRLGWLRNTDGVVLKAARTVSLGDAQRAFVRDWPAGRKAEPVLTTDELMDHTEHYPTATVEYWLRTLPTVRVYPDGRTGRCFEVPVKNDERVSNGSIKLELSDLQAGTWIGERTLRLLDGAEVVFISPFKKRDK